MRAGQMPLRVLIAEDDAVSRKILERILLNWGYEVITSSNGRQAWEMLQQNDIRLVIADWMMPEMDGVELCRKIRSTEQSRYTYIILLTVKGRTRDIVEGLAAGADDYVTKPFDHEELRVRVQAGQRIVELEQALAEKIQALQSSLAHVKRLQGLIPICMHCKKIRDDQDYWHQLEAYISEHSEAQFSHSVCPECYEKYYAPQKNAAEHG